MRYIAITSATLSCLLLSAPAFAGAILEKSEGQVLVSTNAGYAPISKGATLNEGTRIFVKSAKADVTLRFDDGCSLPLTAGQAFTVRKASPCAYEAADLPASRGEPIDPGAGVVAGAGLSPFLIGGIALAAVGAGVAIAVTTSHHSNPPVAFPVLSK